MKKIIGIAIGIVLLATGVIAWNTLMDKKIREQDFLQVDSGKLVTQAGNEVILQGVNLGGWLIQESWMCPVSGEDRKWANLDTLNVLESRFGQQKTAQLIQSYQDNWITQWDIENIAKTGCNVIRVPFWYRNFMLDTAGTWITENLNDNPGFQKLDWVIEAAGKQGMYVILDMHGCPGGQSMDHSSGTLGQNNLYTDETCLNTMELLWTTIAERYKDNPTVAAYDIMNEPQNNAGYEGEHSYDPWHEASWQATNQVYDRMIHAIRSVDERHIITVEGIWRMSNLPDPAVMGWSNMMYQVHLYDTDADFAKWVQNAVTIRDNYGVAVYVGEFQNLNGIAICKEQNVNWTTWTYKGTGSEWSNFFWYYSPMGNADVQNDSYELMMVKWGEQLQTKNFNEITPVLTMIKMLLMQK